MHDEGASWVFRGCAAYNAATDQKAVYEMTDSKDKADEFPQFTATKGGANRTKAGRLRELFAEIEAAQAGGWNYEAIIRGLAEQELEVSLHTLKSAMKRMRAARKKCPPTPESAPKREPVQQTANAADKPEAENPTSTAARGGFSKEGYRQPLQTFTRDVTKQRNWD
ncbi:hypothetical protein [Caballeronia sp. GAWG1-5s-s]|uniref:hypothetical protein n=1 Tax=Caballeronia sp. GAWG1-5s-s TaxID=2921743 RepID=UPI0020283CB5|nr:hypothetical protein [Caballeronia sp. GAWG1-5s-s]